MAHSEFLRIVFPWPDWKLSPNGRSNNINYQASITSLARGDAKNLTLEQLEGKPIFVASTMLWSIWMFSEPDNHTRDRGNMRAAMKAAQDGVFDAIQRDDSIVEDELLFRADVVKGGAVELRLYEDCRQWIDDIIALTAAKRMQGDDE